MDGEKTSTQRQFETVQQELSSFRKATTVAEKMAFYDAWALNYEQDLVVLGYDAAGHAAKTISSHFSGDREAAVVLDVACGTGLVAEKMKQIGFGHFVGIDGSRAMLKEAKNKELYQDLKHCILGEKELPVQKGAFDVVIICGAMDVYHISVSVVRDLCIACKPGGYVCMTCRHSPDNVEYIAALERELKLMEEGGLLRCTAIDEVKNWARGVSASPGADYSPGYVYLYRKL